LEFRKISAILVLAVFTQTACYNTYFISKNELQKLESSAEPQATVLVYGDCPAGTQSTAMMPGQFGLNGSLWAQVKPEDAPKTPAVEAADDALPPEIEEATKEVIDAPPIDSTKKTTTVIDKNTSQTTPPGCTAVRVSGGNTLQIVTTSGNERVTPFNFIMNQKQLVSPEYDLLLTIDEVEGAEVSEFSTFKTVFTIVGVSAVAIGTFVGISLLADPAEQ